MLNWYAAIVILRIEYTWSDIDISLREESHSNGICSDRVGCEGFLSLFVPMPHTLRGVCIQVNHNISLYLFHYLSMYLQ